MKPLDYTLYNRVKAKFQAQPCMIIFVSLAAENIEKLDGILFKPEDLVALRTLVAEYSDKVIPYATTGSFDEGESTFYFACPEFEQEEDLLTGQIASSSIGTYHNNPIDIEAVKREMRMLTEGVLLGGNA